MTFFLNMNFWNLISLFVSESGSQSIFWEKLEFRYKFYNKKDFFLYNTVMQTDTMIAYQLQYQFQNLSPTFTMDFYDWMSLVIWN